jgi:gamma-glutamylcyclotransferase (GGCT)/AIG2-like uncharacterized protein YtfP
VVDENRSSNVEGKLVFVYGTLRKGDCRFGVPSFIDIVHAEAYLKGFQLVNLGSFPGIIPGKGIVRGEIHIYSTFDVLDQIEGYDPAESNYSLFRREKVMVELPFGGEVQASTYVFNRELEDRQLRIIGSGDWFEELGYES